MAVKEHNVESGLPSSPSGASPQRGEGGKAQIASEFQVDWFTAEIEQDSFICNNCFAKRKQHVEHFRTMGGSGKGGGMNDMTADRFCTDCEAGTGKEPLYRDYENLESQIGPVAISEMCGTVERVWCEQTPLPKTGSPTCFSTCLSNLRQRLLDKGYHVEWDAIREQADALKDEHPNRDRVIFAKVMSENTTAPGTTSTESLVSVEDLRIEAAD